MARNRNTFTNLLLDHGGVVSVLDPNPLFPVYALRWRELTAVETFFNCFSLILLMPFSSKSVTAANSQHLSPFNAAGDYSA
jgi:hypothetical protein